MTPGLRSRLADQTAVALPVALAVLFSIAGLATIAAASGVVSGNQALRDRSIKRAYQAAVAGLNTARYRTSLMLPPPAQCVVENPVSGYLANADVQPSGWCAAQSEDLGDGAAYSMTVSQVTGGERTAVATGSAGTVTRRAMLKMSYTPGGSLSFDHALLSRNAFRIENNVDVTGDVGSNGNITTSNNAYVCGDIAPGPGKSWVQEPNSGVQCGGSTSPVPQPFAFPPIDLAGSRTTNDNERLTRMKTNGPNPKDTCSKCNSISWNSSTRVLEMAANATLTLGGTIYNLCRLEMGTNNTLNIASRPSTTPMKIYIDTPENCGGGEGMGSVLIENNSRVYYLGTGIKVIEIYVAGSTETETSVVIRNNAGSGDSDSVLFVYGPNSTINVYNNAVIHGSLVGRDLLVNNNADVTYNSAVASLTPISTSEGYTSHSLRECTSQPTGSTPDTGC
jgi:hypothetical protein